jgi:nitronate monooxygenase
MATRFIATYECDASLKFKENYLKCKKEDLIIIDSPVGLPGRAINNKFLEEVSAGIRKPFKCPWRCLKTCNFENSPYCIALALTNAQQGKLACLRACLTCLRVTHWQSEDARSQATHRQKFSRCIG